MRFAAGLHAGALALTLTGCSGTWDFPDTMQVRDASAPSPAANARLIGSGASAAHCTEKGPRRTGANGLWIPQRQVQCDESLPPGNTQLHVDGALAPVVVVVPADRPVDVELVPPTSANRTLTSISYASLGASTTAVIPTLVGVYGHEDGALTVAGAILAGTLFSFSTTKVLAEVVGPGRIRYRDRATGRRRPDERSVELGALMNTLFIGLGAAATAAGVGVLATDWPNVNTASERAQVNILGSSLFALASVPVSFAVSNLLHAKDRDP